MRNYFISYIGKDSEERTNEGWVHIERIEGIYGSESIKEIQDIIRNELGFVEVVVRSWQEFDEKG